MNINLDADLAKLPPWDLTISVGGVGYPVRQPSLEEDERIDHIVDMKDAAIVELFFSFFPAERPEKSALTRDVLILFFGNLLLYRKLRQKAHARVMVDKALAGVLGMKKTAVPLAGTAN